MFSKPTPPKASRSERLSLYLGWLIKLLSRKLSRRFHLPRLAPVDPNDCLSEHQRRKEQGRDLVGGPARIFDEYANQRIEIRNSFLSDLMIIQSEVTYIFNDHSPLAKTLSEIVREFSQAFDESGRLEEEFRIEEDSIENYQQAAETLDRRISDLAKGYESWCSELDAESSKLGMSSYFDLGTRFAAFVTVIRWWRSQRSADLELQVLRGYHDRASQLQREAIDSGLTSVRLTVREPINAISLEEFLKNVVSQIRDSANACPDAESLDSSGSVGSETSVATPRSDGIPSRHVIPRLANRKWPDDRDEWTSLSRERFVLFGKEIQLPHQQRLVLIALLCEEGRWRSSDELRTCLELDDLADDRAQRNRVSSIISSLRKFLVVNLGVGDKTKMRSVIESRTGERRYAEYRLILPSDRGLTGEDDL